MASSDVTTHNVNASQDNDLIPALSVKSTAISTENNLPLNEKLHTECLVPTCRTEDIGAVAASGVDTALCAQTVPDINHDDPVTKPEAEALSDILKPSITPDDPVSDFVSDAVPLIESVVEPAVEAATDTSAENVVSIPEPSKDLEISEQSTVASAIPTVEVVTDSIEPAVDTVTEPELELEPKKESLPFATPDDEFSSNIIPQPPVHTDISVDELTDCFKAASISSATPAKNEPVPITNENVKEEAKGDKEEEIPLPKGSYTIDWDNIDEFSDPSNPFGTNKQVVAETKSSNLTNNKLEVAQTPVANEKDVADQVLPAPEQVIAVLPDAIPTNNLDTVIKAEESTVAAESKSDISAVTGVPECDQPAVSEGISAKKVDEIIKTESAVAPESKSDISLVTAVPESAESAVCEEPVAVDTVKPEPEAGVLEEAVCPVQATPDTMEEDLPLPPKASYTIDWDNFDENTNPFESKKAMSNSPPGSPKIKPQNDPFKSSSKVALSPPGSPKLNSKTNVETNISVEQTADKVDNNNVNNASNNNNQTQANSSAPKTKKGSPK